MKRLLTATLLTLSIAAPNAFAGDTRLELPLQELLDSPQAKEAGIDGSFFLPGRPGPPRGGLAHGRGRFQQEDQRRRQERCRILPLGRPVGAQGLTRKAPRRAAPTRWSTSPANFKKNEFKSPTNYECYAGNIMSGVALKGTYAKVK